MPFPLRFLAIDLELASTSQCSSNCHYFYFWQFLTQWPSAVARLSLPSELHECGRCPRQQRIQGGPRSASGRERYANARQREETSRKTALSGWKVAWRGSIVVGSTTNDSDRIRPTPTPSNGLTVFKDRPSTPMGTVPARATGRLPHDLLEQAARRLALACLVYAGLWGVYFVLHVVGLAKDDEFIVIPAAIVSVLMGLAVAILARSGWLAPERILSVALVFEVLSSATIAVSELWGCFSATSATWPGVYGLALLEHFNLIHVSKLMMGGASWVGAWIIFFPLLVPNPPRKVLIASLAAAATVPLTLVLTFAVKGVAEPVAGQRGLLLFFASLSPFLCAVMASIGARIVYRYASELRRARELGSYRLLRKLGQGGMGEVWLAEHRMLARPAAIKLIRAATLDAGSGPNSETARRRFEREAQATASLSSPHAVHLHDYGVASDGTFYYVMELLDGLDLESLVEQFGPIPPERAAHFLRQACHALGEAHDAGLIHRDVKPANLYTCRYGRDYDFIKVLDFGLVKAVAAKERFEAQLTGDQSVMGTPAYIAPEIIAGTSDIDGRVDIYGLGCVAYFLLAGRPVFEAEGLMQLVVSHLQKTPVPPSRRSPHPIPAAFERLVLQCLEKEPARRPQTPDELVRALDACTFETPWTAERAETWWHQHKPQPGQAPVGIEENGLISRELTSEVSISPAD
jgi:eukaryotic-like serine/threonine-protein kinase